MTPEHAVLAELERSLWTSETRFDSAEMEVILADDFHEFGRSGRRYAKGDMLLAENDAKEITAVLHDLAIKDIAETAALITYISEEQLGTRSVWSNRASLWISDMDRWKLHFHQGTPTDALP